MYNAAEAAIDSADFPVMGSFGAGEVQMAAQAEWQGFNRQQLAAIKKALVASGGRESR